ncbi:aminotransferase class IV [Frankia sp. Cj3]|uniref:aminotransferase class IV n=1 Tax=Frankia sp. Cj3 TaxID=2880976 RepID=UPI001EF60C83|nr:aminotransferase class IV [Frankia sp. Cj3]
MITPDDIQTSATARMRWVGSGAGADCAPGGFALVNDPSRPLVVDSWLMDDGRVRAWPAHLARFSSACARMTGLPAARCVAFMVASVRQLPATGRWFPRVELVMIDDRPRLQLWPRPAPARGEAVRLWISPTADQRVQPTVKGADLGYLAELRQAAVRAGADETLLLSADGRVREGTTTSVLWWRGKTLCLPPDTPHLLPGVTCAAILGLAATRGVRVQEEESRPRDLAGLEVWAVNALHGIRPVRGWVGASIDAGPSRRERRWNTLLRDQAIPPSECGTAAEAPVNRR